MQYPATHILHGTVLAGACRFFDQYADVAKRENFSSHLFSTHAVGIFNGHPFTSVHGPWRNVGRMFVLTTHYEVWLELTI